jgi:UDP-galactopyranose mutase
VAIRTNSDDRYFSDWHQKMPADGYASMFGRILEHPGIEVRTGVAFDDIRGDVAYSHLVYTGRIDAYFAYEYGRLPYRSLEFVLRNEPTADGRLLQPVGTINYVSEDVEWTRVTEYRHLTGQTHESSTLAIEYPRTEGDPYYPIPSDDTQALYRRYAGRAADAIDVTFVGRLARYQYLDMDQVVGQALTTFQKLVARGAVTGRRRQKPVQPQEV